MTVVLLVALAVLLFWGTLYQSLAGLDVGTARFFDSWFVWVFRILPIPALKSLLVLCVVNLFFSMYFRIPRRLQSAGLYLIHGGLLFLIIGSFVADAFRETNDAYVLEGPSESHKNRLTTVLKSGLYEITLADTLSYPIKFWKPSEFSLGAYDFKILDICKDAIFDIVEESPFESLPKNRIGFPAKMQCVASEEKERPGVLLWVKHQGWKKEERVLLSIMDRDPFVLSGGESLQISLQQDRLPFAVTVLSADTAGADVVIEMNGESYPRRIALNSPLKLSPYAVYFGGITSVIPEMQLVHFVVRRDYFSFVPYVFSLLTGLGLCLHFGCLMLRKREKK